MLTNCLVACTHLSSTVSQLFEPQVQKNRRFHVPQPIFLFPLETPLRLSRNMLHGWKDNSVLAKPLAACTYLSSIVSELYVCVSPKSLFLPHFCFSWGRPWVNHAKCCMDGKRIRCLQIDSLTARAHLTITVSEIERDICEKKSSFYHTPCIRRPRLGGFRRNIAIPFGMEKLEFLGYPVGRLKKK